MLGTRSSVLGKPNLDMSKTFTPETCRTRPDDRMRSCDARPCCRDFVDYGLRWCARRSPGVKSTRMKAKPYLMQALLVPGLAPKRPFSLLDSSDTAVFPQRADVSQGRFPRTRDKDYKRQV